MSDRGIIVASDPQRAFFVSANRAAIATFVSHPSDRMGSDRDSG
jgi:hypothetical protein